MKTTRIYLIRLVDKEVAAIVEALVAQGNWKLAEKVLKQASKGLK